MASPTDHEAKPQDPVAAPAADPTPAPAPDAAAAPAPSATDGATDAEIKVFTRAEVAMSVERQLIIIKNKVYDVSAYMDDHPGGEDPLLEYLGADASTAFDDIGHSASAKRTMKAFLIGKLTPEDEA